MPYTAGAVLWLCVCILARTDRQREICLVGTLILLAALVLGQLIAT